MKKSIIALALTLTVTAGILTGCSSSGDTSSANTNTSTETSAAENETAPEVTKIIAGFCPGPYEDMFRDAIAPSLIELGYEVDYILFSDYVQPNKALADGEVNVNLFQHSVYLENFKETHGLDLVKVTEVPTASMGIFSDTVASFDELPDGATVAIANDDTNLSRSIRVLEQAGLLTIDPDIDPTTASQYTISENPYNFNFVEIEAAQLPRALESVDLALIPGNYAISAGLDLSTAIYNETLLDGYINVVAVRTEDQNAQFVQDINNIVHSDAFRSIIEDPAYPYTSFQKPAEYAN